jgi:hypothetical protein
MGTEANSRHVCSDESCCQRGHSFSGDSDLSPTIPATEWKTMSWVWHLKRFALWGLAFFGIYASSSTCLCPF